MAKIGENTPEMVAYEYPEYDVHNGEIYEADKAYYETILSLSTLIAVSGDRLNEVMLGAADSEREAVKDLDDLAFLLHGIMENYRTFVDFKKRHYY